MNIHIYRADSQPLTRWRIGADILPKPSKWFVTNPRKLDWCENCFRTRWAKNLRICVFYDCSRITCAGGCEPSNYRERYNRRRKLVAKTTTGPMLLSKWE